MQSMDRLTPLMLARFTQIDYDREMALVAVIKEHTPGRPHPRRRALCQQSRTSSHASLR